MKGRIGRAIGSTWCTSTSLRPGLNYGTGADVTDVALRHFFFDIVLAGAMYRWDGGAWVAAAFKPQVSGSWVNKPTYVRQNGVWFLLGGADTGINKRRSIIGIFPVPDGTINAGDRMQVLGLYRRI